MEALVPLLRFVFCLGKVDDMNQTSTFGVTVASFHHLHPIRSCSMQVCNKPRSHYHMNEHDLGPVDSCEKLGHSVCDLLHLAPSAVNLYVAIIVHLVDCSCLPLQLATPQTPATLT